MSKSLNPSLSVVMPVFNCESFLEEAVVSILNQTYRNFELIIIDDGSTDGSLSLLKKLAQTDSRIKLISRENRGLVHTLNEGILVARAPWIARMDGDDISHPDRFQCQIDFLQKNNQVDILGSAIQLFGDGANRIKKYPTSHQGIQYNLMFESSFAHGSVVMNALKLKRMMYNFQMEYAEDYDLWIRCSMAGWQMANLPEVLLFYRQHARQSSVKKFAKQQELSVELRTPYWVNIFANLGIDPSAISHILELRRFKPKSYEIDKIDYGIRSLLSKLTGEPRAVIYGASIPLYVRAASQTKGIVDHWIGATYSFNVPLYKRLPVMIVLFLMRLFRVVPDSGLYFVLQKYFFLIFSGKST